LALGQSDDARLGQRPQAWTSRNPLQQHPAAQAGSSQVPWSQSGL
jgi:hypothetical protein